MEEVVVIKPIKDTDACTLCGTVIEMIDNLDDLDVVGKLFALLRK